MDHVSIVSHRRHYSPRTEDSYQANGGFRSYSGHPKGKFLATLKAASGRLPEIVNDRFVEAKLEKTVDVRRAAIETTDGQVWVGKSQPTNKEAVIPERLQSGSNH